jgi:hypothetical protein
MKIISEARERTPNDPSPPFKEKEKGGESRSKVWWTLEGGGEGSWLGGQWKEGGRKGSWLGGQWNVPTLVANGR